MTIDGGVFARRMRPEMIHDLSPSDSHEVHVLAVDDSLVDRTVIERLLKITSCKVTAVDSGRRALQILGLDDERSSVTSGGVDAMKVDLIITDYCMPGMTGYELLKKIKGSSTFREIPVVIMSSENVLTRIDRCLEEGAEDFLLKPVKLSDVKRLKGYMFGEDRVETEQRGINKRKSPEPSDVSPSQSEPSITPSLSPSSSPPHSSSTSPSPSPSSPDSPLPHSSSSRSLPCPPTSLDSPTRRLRMTNCD